MANRARSAVAATPLGERCCRGRAWALAGCRRGLLRRALKGRRLVMVLCVASNVDRNVIR